MLNSDASYFVDSLHIICSGPSGIGVRVRLINVSTDRQRVGHGDMER